ncbi:hypothetical protein OROMI_019743 [Orobanche minor]
MKMEAMKKERDEEDVKFMPTCWLGLGSFKFNRRKTFMANLYKAMAAFFEYGEHVRLRVSNSRPT